MDDKERKNIREWENRNDADDYRLLQANELLLRFEEEKGRKASSVEELEEWVATKGFEKPIIPRLGLKIPQHHGPIDKPSHIGNS